MRLHPDLDHAETVDEACTDEDVVLHLTEWKQFSEIDPAKLAAIEENLTITAATPSAPPFGAKLAGPPCPDRPAI